MTLVELLEPKFRGDIRFRGAAYVHAERVAIVRVTQDHLFAVVRDGIEYHTQISREENELKLSCNCATQPAKGKPAAANCKHLWATVLAADAGQYVSGAAKPGFVPPFRAESDELSFDDDDWDDDDDGLMITKPRPLSKRPVRDDDEESFRPMAGGATSTATATKVAAPEWELRLQELRRSMQSVDGANSGSAGRESQIFYEIDARASEEAGLLVVQTSQRQRRSSGQWGKLKPLKVKPGKFEEIDDDEDRRILAHLAGGTPDRSTAGALPESAFATHRYRVPFELCLLLLPTMCATGRVCFISEDDTGREMLVWDNAPPWELYLDLKHDEGKSNWGLFGSIRREGERLAITDPSLMLPGGLVFARGRISRLEDFDAFAWVKLLRQGVALEANDGEERDLVDRLHDMPTLPRLELPEELRLEEVRLEPKPYLLIAAPGKGRWQHDRLKAEVLFQYDDRMVRGSSGEWAVVQRAAGRCLVRNKSTEDRFWTLLNESGFRRLVDHRRGQFDVEIPSREIGTAVRRLMDAGWQVRAEGKQVRQPGELKFQVKSGVDWFELHGNVEFEGQSVAFPELLAALQRGDGTIVLDDGSLGVLPEEWLQRYGMLGGLGVLSEDHLRFSTAQVSLLDALLATREDVDYDSRFVEIREAMANFSGIEEIPESATFQGELRPYQRSGVGWLQFLDKFAFGGCLADDMGLGKTIQMLAFLEGRLPDKNQNKLPSLAVVPKSLLFNWQQEAAKFTPRLRVLEYTGLERARLRDEFENYDLIVTTYGTLRRDFMILKDVPFDYVILDEAQAIKNSTSQVAKAVRLLNGRRRVALSGTPIENHLGDLCSIFEFLNPGLLGRSSLFRLHAADSKDPETRKLLAQGLRPFILRRTKQGVASELPEKIEQTVLCEMGPEQERLYHELREHYRDLLLGLIETDGISKARFHVLEALLRLRQAACHPALLHKSSDTESSAKLDVLCAQLESLLAEGHKALVFSQFTSMLAIVRKHLEERGIVYEYLDGQTRDRKGRVNRFQSDDACGVFLISLKAGGLGLNLTAADYVFILDPWWNPAVEAQAIDRAHRVGQTRQVVAYRLICRNTVEEKIAELQQHKRELADAILEQDGSLLQNLTAEDLQKLLS